MEVRLESLYDEDSQKDESGTWSRFQILNRHQILSFFDVKTITLSELNVLPSDKLKIAVLTDRLPPAKGGGSICEQVCACAIRLTGGSKSAEFNLI